VSWSRNGRYLFGQSYELGAIRLTRKFLGNGQALTREAMQRVQDHALDQFRKRSPSEVPTADRAVAGSGNVRAIDKMAQSLRGNSFSKLLPEITIGTLEDLAEVAAGRTPQSLASLFDLNIERARIVMPAVMVLLASMRHFGIRRLETTESGLREGVAGFWSRHGHLNIPVSDSEEESHGEEPARNGRK
jgi:exopolyphosphatase/pppGpp-phosphohydrolase